MFGLTFNGYENENDARDYFREMEDRQATVFYMLLTDAVRR